jgi:hypothetical protein
MQLAGEHIPQFSIAVIYPSDNVNSFRRNMRLNRNCKQQLTIDENPPPRRQSIRTHSVRTHSVSSDGNSFDQMESQFTASLGTESLLNL